MKRIKITVLLGMMVFAMVANAIPIDRNTATTIAVNFWKTHASKSMATGMPTITNYASANGLDNMYIFSINEGNGFVIVSADDRVWPILGYSTTGNLDGENIPVNTKEMLQNFNEEIQYCMDNNLPANPLVSSEWNRLLSAEPVSASENGKVRGNGQPSLVQTTVVGPLVKTKWDQGAPYNNLCPYDSGNGERTVVGCVATAMAQILKYWNYPQHGIGSKTYTHTTERRSPNISFGTFTVNFANTTYDWANMPVQVSNSSSNAEKTAVATLSYHCGVSVEMMYDISSNGGSSAYTNGDYNPTAEYAFKNYFDYKSSATSEYRYYYSDSAWNMMVKSEIDNGRPLLYRGSTSNGGGHAFVCDGYDVTGISGAALYMFHYNWGWSGRYDGYFLSNALYPAGGGIGSNSSNSYNDYQAIIVGLEPRISPLIVSLGNSIFSGLGDSTMAVVRAADNSSLNWTASCGQSWITLSDRTGAGNGAMTNVKITASPNNTNVARRAVITITQGAESKTIEVVQGAASYSPQGEYGNTVTSYLKCMDAGMGCFMRGEAYGNFAPGDTIKSVFFNSYYNATYPDYNGNRFRIEIYENNTFDSNMLGGYWVSATNMLGQLVHTQNYTQPAAGMQHVTLSTPYIIDTGNFWIAVFCVDSTQMLYHCNYLSTPCALSDYPVADSMSAICMAYREGMMIPIYGGAYADTNYPAVYQSNDEWTMGFTVTSRIAATLYDVIVVSESASKGSAMGSGSYEVGDTVVLRAVPNAGYRFLRWNDGNTSNPRSIVINSSMNCPTYTAYFTHTYTITANSNDNSQGRVYGGGIYGGGDTVALYAIPVRNCNFERWNDADTTNPRFVVVNSNRTFTATFAQVPVVHDTTAVHDTTYITNIIHDTTYITDTVHDTVNVVLPTDYKLLQVNSADVNKGLAAGNGSFPAGTSVEIAAIPLQGYHFVSWNDGNTSNPRLVTVDADITYTASFTENTTEVSIPDDMNYDISTSTGTITVSGADNQRIRLFDNLGRLLFTEQNAPSVKTFVVPVSGTYMVQVGNYPAQKVVVIR